MNNPQDIIELDRLRERLEELEKVEESRGAREMALQQRAEGFASLYKITLHITKPYDLHSLLKTIIEKAVSLLNGTGGGIFMCDPDREEVRCMTNYGMPHNFYKSVRKYGEGISGIVAQTGKPLIIDDFDKWPGRTAFSDRERPFTSLISAPMTWQDEVMGVIHVIHSKQTGRYSKVHLELLAMFANQAAIAIENARLMERVQKDAVELQKRFDEIERRTIEIKGANRKLQKEIEQRIHTERELKESEEKYRTILESIEEGYYETDVQGNFTFFNDALSKMLGCPYDELMGRNLQEFTDDENKKKGVDAFMGVYRSGVPLKEFAWEVIRQDGQKRIVEASVSLMWDKDLGTRKAGFRGILRDITKRKEAEEALKESEERFRVFVEKSPLGISLIDRDNRYKYTNPKFIEIFGYALADIPTGEEWLNKAFPDPVYRNVVISDWINDLKDYDVGEARPCTYNVRCKDGSIKIIHFRSVVMERGKQIIFYEDITDQKNLEAKLVQAQKMESLGTLAGGMAHNFNNLLMGIQGNSSLMLLEADSKHPFHIRLKNIEKLVSSGSKLTRQLLGYARKGQYEIKPISLNQLIQETSDTFGVARKEIRIHHEFDPCGSVILADQGQIEQVLLNLYVNAADAMPEGGDLFLETANVTSDDMLGRSYNPKPGNYILLTVRDTGVGMDGKTMECIYDPFFTTKCLGKGTGLGLSSVYGIVKAHGGYIDVESEKNKGTIFSLYLQRSEENSQNNLTIPATTKEGMGGNETILFVDDEAFALDVGANILKTLGYDVLQAKNGKSAVEIYEKNRDKIDLVILDMILPDMSGGKAYDRLKEINSEIKVLLSSGYSIDGQATEILKRGCNGFLQKPFSIEKLSQCVREVLEN